MGSNNHKARHVARRSTQSLKTEVDYEALARECRGEYLPEEVPNEYQPVEVWSGRFNRCRSVTYDLLRKMEKAGVITSKNFSINRGVKVFPVMHYALTSEIKGS